MQSFDKFSGYVNSISDKICNSATSKYKEIYQNIIMYHIDQQKLRYLRQISVYVFAI